MGTLLTVHNGLFIHFMTSAESFTPDQFYICTKMYSLHLSKVWNYSRITNGWSNFKPVSCKNQVNKPTCGQKSRPTHALDAFTSCTWLTVLLSYSIAGTVMCGVQKKYVWHIWWSNNWCLERSPSQLLVSMLVDFLTGWTCPRKLITFQKELCAVSGTGHKKINSRFDPV